MAFSSRLGWPPPIIWHCTEFSDTQISLAPTSVSQTSVHGSVLGTFWFPAFECVPHTKLLLRRWLTWLWTWRGDCQGGRGGGCPGYHGGGGRQAGGDGRQDHQHGRWNFYTGRILVTSLKFIHDLKIERNISGPNFFHPECIQIVFLHSVAHLVHSRVNNMSFSVWHALLISATGDIFFTKLQQQRFPRRKSWFWSRRKVWCAVDHFCHILALSVCLSGRCHYLSRSTTEENKECLTLASSQVCCWHSQGFFLVVFAELLTPWLFFLWHQAVWSDFCING